MPSSFWSVVGSSTTETWKPAASRSERAVSSSSPVTSGTALAGCGFAPIETLIRTAAPRRRLVPGAGRCATTVPDGLDEATYAVRTWKPAAWSFRCAAVCDRPTTLGTLAEAAVVVVGVVPPEVVVAVVVAAAGAPCDTLIRTREPFGAFAPALGFCATTNPRGEDDGTLK